MWAQMLKTRVKPGQESTAEGLPQEMDGRMQGASSAGGPSRVLVFRDQNDRSAYITVIMFESEEQARRYEGSPEQASVRERMMQVWDGPPEFTDLELVHEFNR